MPALNERMTLPIGDAADYVGCRNVKQFRREVEQGVWPKPIAAKSRPQRWSRLQLDRYLAGEPEPAHNDGLDPIMERIRGLVKNAVR